MLGPYYQVTDLTVELHTLRILILTLTWTHNDGGRLPVVSEMGGEDQRSSVR